MELQTQPLSEHFGLEVQGVDLADLDGDSFAAIYRLWQQEPLLLFRRQSLTEAEQVAFSRGFGDLDVIVRDDMHSPLNPEIIYITSLKRPDGTALGGLGSYEVRWHHDQVYRQRPASGSIFYAIEMPEGDGRTSFCNTKLAYDALPDNLRARIDGRRATCRYGNRSDVSFQQDFANNAARVAELNARTPPATHDIVLQNPATGQKSIYLDPNKTFEIDGLEAGETEELITALSAHMLRPEFVHTHVWRNGDVVMWDNARLWHRREAFNEALPRFAKRTTIFLNPADFAVPEPDLT